MGTASVDFRIRRRWKQYTGDMFREDVVGAWKAVSKVYGSEDGLGNSFLRKPKSSALLHWESRGEQRL